MGTLLVTFLVYGPKAIGGGVDEIIFFFFLDLGLVSVWWTKRYHSSITVSSG